MEIIYVLLPLSLLLALLGVGLYLWAVRSGQLEDLDTPAMRILFDDTKNENPQAGLIRTEENRD